MTKDHGLRKTLENLRQSIETRDSAKLFQLPLWPDAKRGTPNSFLRSALFSAIQSKDREFISGKELASQTGIRITFTGEQLNQEDLTLWEALVHLAKSHPLGNVCSFTAHGILKTMGLNTGGHDHQRLEKGITRLIACAVKIKEEGRQPYIGSLVEAAIGDDPSLQRSHYTVRINPEMIRLYGETQWTAIDWQQRLKLRRKPLAQAMHAYYSTHRIPHPVKLATLQSLTGSRNEQASGFKRHCRSALDELVKIGFLQSYNVQGDMVTVNRFAVLPRSK